MKKSINIKYLIFIWIFSVLILGGGILLKTDNSESTPEVIQAVSTKNAPLVESPSHMGTAVAPKPLESSSQLEEEIPLQFIFPTPGVPPVSFWRPPLYDTPWGLTANDHFLFSRPVAADEVNWPLADYRYGYFFPDTDIVHTGIDIDASRGTPVIAAAPGKVIWTGYGLYYGSYNKDDPYGLAVTILHDFGWNNSQIMTVYAHMDRIDVEVGQIVETGTQLGLLGNTGLTTGPHLHFEVRLASNSFFRTRNPELWLVPPQGWGVLVGQLRESNYSFMSYQEVYVKKVDSDQVWMVRTYGPSSVNRDDYYQENLVLSDLPAGDYIIYFTHLGKNYKKEITIYPGTISYFQFQVNRGFSLEPPEIQSPEEWKNVILSNDLPQN
jgi:murein DD-endopeptidase MepM/ murein hydrolase activator NlpD